MPVVYAFANGILRLTLSGASSHGDIAAAINAALNDAARPPLRGLLLDARGSTTASKRTSAQIRSIANELARNASDFGGRLALLASSDVVYGLMRMGEVWFQAGGEVFSRVFRDEGEAVAWLSSDGALGGAGA